MGNVLRDEKGLRGPWFYSSDKMFLPMALECGWDMSQPHNSPSLLGLISRTDMSSWPSLVWVQLILKHPSEIRQATGMTRQPQYKLAQALWLAFIMTQLVRCWPGCWVYPADGASSSHIKAGLTVTDTTAATPEEFSVQMCPKISTGPGIL